MDRFQTAQPAWAELYVIERVRDERTLRGERLPAILRFAPDLAGARTKALATSGLSLAIIEDMVLYDPNIDPGELCAVLTYLTGDLHTICPYEVDVDTFDRLFEG